MSTSSDVRPTFTREQLEYVADLLTRVWKYCHDEHCHKEHDCKNDINHLIDELVGIGLNESQIYIKILGLKAKL